MWRVKQSFGLTSNIWLDLKDDVKSKEQEDGEMIWTRNKTKTEEI